MDEALLLAINGLRSPGLDALMAPLSEWGIYAFPLGMLLFLARADRIREGRSIRDGWLTWFVATAVGETILKPLVGRLRPTSQASLREALEVLGSVPPPTSLSFPSGTAVAAFSGAVFIGVRWGWRFGGPAVLLATLVGLSRVYAGLHWPSDILGGAVLGASAAVGLDRLLRRLQA